MLRDKLEATMGHAVTFCLFGPSLFGIIRADNEARYDGPEYSFKIELGRWNFILCVLARVLAHGGGIVLCLRGFSFLRVMD